MGTQGPAAEGDRRPVGRSAQKSCEANDGKARALGLSLAGPGESPELKNGGKTTPGRAPQSNSLHFAFI